MLTASGVRLSYGSSVALAGASVSVEPGEIVAITGSSGSGKTSLLYCLAGLVRPTYGTVSFAGQDLATCNREVLSAIRRKSFGFVFQFAELVPELTLRENVSLPLELLGVRAGARRARVEGLLAELGLAEHAGRRPAQVSGGQAQRAATARALVHRPRVVFADEPTGSLDNENGGRVLQALIELSRSSDAAVVLVTHDEKVALTADRVVHMSDGRVVEPGR